MRDTLILIVIEQSLNHQMEVQTLNITLHMLKQLLLLKIFQFSQQTQQTLKAYFQLFVVAFLHGLVHPTCQDRMDLQVQNELQVFYIDDGEYLLEESEDGHLEGWHFSQEVDQFCEEFFGEDVGHETSAVVIVCKEVEQVYALLPHLREVLQASSDYLRQSYGAKNLQLMRLQEFPVALEHQKQLREELQVLILSLISLDVLYNIQSISNAFYRLFRYEICLKDGDDGAKEVQLHHFHLLVFLFYTYLLLHVRDEVIEHYQNVQKQWLHLSRLCAFLQSVAVQIRQDVQAPYIIFHAFGRVEQILLQVHMIFRPGEQVIANQKVRVLLRAVHFQALVEAMIELVLQLLVLIAVVDFP